MRQELIVLIAYLLTEFATYILAYKVIFQKKINRNIINWIIVTAVIGAIHSVTYVYAGLYNAISISMFSMVVIPLMLLEKREKEGLLLYPIVLMGTAVFAVSGTYVMALLFDIPEYMLTEGSILTIVCQLVPVFILIVLYLYRTYKKKEVIRLEMDRRQYALFYIVIICSYLMLACMQLLSSNTLTVWESNICGLAISVTCMVMVWVSCRNGVIVYNERKYKEKNELYEKYIKLQEEYFEEIQQRDESMRRFRHDMNAHIIALRELCESEDKIALKEYLDNMVEYSAIYKVEEYTGNKTLDAVIRQLVFEAENKEINIKIQGCYLQLEGVSIFDFCSIIYNLVKNAIEACEKINDMNERNIEMKLAQYNNKIFIKITNRINEVIIIENNMLKTSKEDKKNHGLGSGNVEKAVEKYNGSIEYISENGYFSVEVYI